MKTAIITGASAGLGVQFVTQLKTNFPEIEEVWLIARRRDRLEAIANKHKEQFASHILPLDLCSPDSYDALRTELEERKPDVALLINNAGCGYLGNVHESDLAKQTRMTDLNVTALTAVTTLVLPYMSRGSHIINVSSISSFCPNPRMTVYSSTKAYVSSFTRGLSEELRSEGIVVTATCPGPMDTEFLDIAGISGNSKTFDMLPRCIDSNVVSGVYRAAKRGKVFHTPKGFFKFFRIIAKILPQSLMVKFTKT